MSSSKAMLSYDNYSHTYELKYGYCIMIMIYELVQSLCIMRIVHLTLCLTNHITYIIGLRVKLRWRFIVSLDVPKFFTCRSVQLGTRGIWVVSVHASVVLGYGETGDCIVPFHG
jgi:hypothetical protein